MTREAHQPLSCPDRICSTCTNARLPDWISAGQQPYPILPGSAARGRGCFWPGVLSSPSLSRAAGRNGGLLEELPLQRQKPDSQSFLVRRALTERHWKAGGFSAYPPWSRLSRPIFTLVCQRCPPGPQCCCPNRTAFSLP